MGARAVPAGGVVNRSRAAPGINLPALPTGREVLAGLGQVKAGNARKNRVGSAPGMGIVTGSAPIPSPRKRGLEQGPWEEISPGPKPWWNADRRAAPSFILPRLRGRIKEGGSGRASSTAGWKRRLSAFHILSFSCAWRSERSGQQKAGTTPSFSDRATLFALSPWRQLQKLGRICAARTRRLSSSPVQTGEVAMRSMAGRGV